MSLRRVRTPQSSTRSDPPVLRSSSRNEFLAVSTPVTRGSRPSETHIGTVERHTEFADDSDNDVNLSHFNYSDHFTQKELTLMKKEMWYNWLVYSLRKARQRFVPSWKTLRETFTIVTLAVMICFYLRDNYKSESENPNSHFNMELERQKFQQLISVFTSEFHDFETRVKARLDHNENQLDAMKGWQSSMIFELNSIKKTQIELSEMLENMRIDIDNNMSKYVPVEPTPPEPSPVVPTGLQSHPNSFSPVIYRRPLPGVNVANSLIGASIDETCSSRTASAKDGLFYDVMSYVVSFQEGYVLLDRDVLSPGQAWCTYDRRPTLTVKLARFVHPTAVSYQHVRWNGIVPNHAPKLYDLVACRSSCCTKWEPLITNCTYKSSEDGHDEQEQFCHVPPSLHLNPVKHVQFRFRENHGNMTKTCAYLVRVYGEPVEIIPEPTEGNGTSSQLDTELINSLPKSS